jgi:hypothetical protein
MQSSNIAPPRDETTKSLHDYFNNNYYKNLITLSLILMFAIVFYLIYLIIDSLIDKNYHQFMSIQAYERYETQKLKSMKSKQRAQAIQAAQKGEADFEGEENDESQIKRKTANRTRKIEFTSWSHRNLHVSFIHSLLCSLWLIRIVTYRNMDLFNDLLGFVSWDTYLLLAFSCGYFLYDFYDIYANGYVRIEWVVCLHHAIVLLTFGYHMINLINIGYTVVALFMEFNSVFLHARKLLRFYNFKTDSLIVRANSIMNILTFVIFRFGVLICIVLGIYYDGKRVTLRYLIMLSTCSFLMAIINVILFKRILIKDWLRNKKHFTMSNNINDTSNTPVKSHHFIEQVNLLDASHRSDEQILICDSGDLNNNLKQNSSLVLNMKYSMQEKNASICDNFNMVNKKYA